MMDNTSINLDEGKQNEPSIDRIFFQLMEKAGTSGRYQVITTFLLSLTAYLCGGLLFITPFLFYQEPYECDAALSSDQCHSFVCSLNESERVRYLPIERMNTLANHFGDYRCEAGKSELNIILTVMYSSSVLGYLLMTLLGGVIGRKSLMISSLFLTLVGILVTIFCVNVVMAGVGLFVSFVGIQNGFNVCFYFLSQTVAESMRQKSSVIVQLFYGFGLIVNVGAYYWLNDWKLIFWIFYIAPTVLVLTAFVLLVKDTPMCLVMRESAEKALLDLTFIARINGINEQQLLINKGMICGIKYDCSIRQNKKEKVSFNICDLFRYKSLRGMTIMLIVLQMTVIFEFYAPALMIDQFKLNIFINGIVVAISEIVAYPLCFCLITRCRRRSVAFVCFALSFICSFVLVFLWTGQVKIQSSSDITANVGVLVLVFLFRFAITVQYTFFIIYYNQLYPTQVRVQGTGLVSVMGGVMATVIPQIIDVCESNNFPIMIIFAILSALSGVVSIKLPETYKKTPSDVVQQLRKKIQARSKRRISIISVCGERKDEES